jgi:hypothetical protein
MKQTAKTNAQKSLPRRLEALAQQMYIIADIMEIAYSADNCNRLDLVGAADIALEWAGSVKVENEEIV